MCLFWAVLVGVVGVVVVVVVVVVVEVEVVVVVVVVVFLILGNGTPSAARRIDIQLDDQFCNGCGFACIHDTSFWWMTKTKPRNNEHNYTYLVINSIQGVPLVIGWFISAINYAYISHKPCIDMQIICQLSQLQCYPAPYCYMCKVPLEINYHYWR